MVSNTPVKSLIPNADESDLLSGEPTVIAFTVVSPFVPICNVIVVLEPSRSFTELKDTQWKILGTRSRGWG